MGVKTTKHYDEIHLWACDNAVLQITSPRFPVVVKMGHAHSGMGKVVLNTHFTANTVFPGPIMLIDLYFDLCCGRWKWTINMIFKILPASWHWPRLTPHLSHSSTPSTTSASRRSVTITKLTCEWNRVSAVFSFKMSTRWCVMRTDEDRLTWKWVFNFNGQENINFWELENQHWLIYAGTGGHVRQVRAQRRRWDEKQCVL